MLTLAGETKAAAIRVTADELTEACVDDEKAAARKYGGRLADVTGVQEEGRRGVDDGGWPLYLSGTADPEAQGRRYQVGMRFEAGSEDLARAKAPKPGQRVTVRGRVGRFVDVGKVVILVVPTISPAK